MIKPGLPPASRFYRLLGALLVCAWLPACASAPASRITPAADSTPVGSTPVLTPVSIDNPTPTLASTSERSTPSPTPIPDPSICSPFPGFSQADLIASISNPFHPPPPGSDDPHQAVDLAVQQDGLALAGGPAQAVLSGSVAMVTQDRFPYGYAVLVETPLEQVPLAWLPKIDLPTPAPTRPSNPALTCPPVTPSPPWDETRRSLYLLYAHLQEPAAFHPSDLIQCGQVIGRIGQSGNALNPHLHLEARVGPAGARFASMAHYDNTASPEEMGNYCVWRISEAFQLLDPLRLLRLLP